MTGDLFSFRGPQGVIVIPTNGKVKYGAQIAVMGAGVALQAAKIWPLLPKLLGRALVREGNVVHKFLFKSQLGEEWVVTFPIKEHWAEPSNLKLLAQNAEALAKWVNDFPGTPLVYLPRLGCGLGGLQWPQVSSVLSRYLDSRFTVVSRR